MVNIFVIFINCSLETLIPILIFLTRSSCQILDKIQTGLFPTSGFLVKSLTNKHSFNYKTSNGIDMKLGPLSKLGKRNIMTSRTFDNDLIRVNYGAIFILQIFGEFASIWKPHSGRIIGNPQFSLMTTLYLTKTENRSKKPLTRA